MSFEKSTSVKQNTSTKSQKKIKLDKKLPIYTKEEEIILSENLNPEYLQNNQKIIGQVRSIAENYSLTTEEKKALDLLTFRFITANIVNAVAPITIGKPIDIKRVVETCKKHNLEYKLHSKFSGVPVRFVNNISFTAVFFKSGKINVIGLEEDTPEYLKEVVNVIAKYQDDFFEPGINVRDCPKRLANRVYAVSIPKVIQLNKLRLFTQLKNWVNIKYCSQGFPGVTIKFTEYKSKILFFKTGSSIISGVTSEHCKEHILKEFITILCEYMALSKVSQ